MKVTRYKKANKRINFYINNFKYRPPIQMLIDGTFCCAAIKVRNLISSNAEFDYFCDFRASLPSRIS